MPLDTSTFHGVHLLDADDIECSYGISFYRHKYSRVYIRDLSGNESRFVSLNKDLHVKCFLGE